MEASNRRQQPADERRQERRPHRGDPGRRHRGRLPGRAARDLQRDHDRLAASEGVARLRGAAAPRRRPRPRGRHGRHRRPRARHGGRRHRRPDHRARSATRRSAASSTCSATPIDEGGDVEAEERWPIHRPAPTVEDLTPTTRDVRDRHQGRRPARALRQGRQGRPVRRRRRRQDGAHPGADPQPRQGARRPVGVLRRGRALARGQRPLARDEGVGRHRQDDARLRPDERAARRAHARRAVRPDDGGVLPRREGQDVLLFIDNIFRFVQAGSEVSALLGPHALAGRLPADARDRDGPAAGADHLDPPGLGHLGPGDLRAGRRPHRPGAGVGVRPPQRDDGALARDLREGHLPGGRPARLDLDDPQAGHRRRGALQRRQRRSRRSCSATRSCRTSSRSSASTSSPTRTSSPCSARARSSASCRSRSSWPSSSPARRASTCRSPRRCARFKEILEGKHDDLPERAFLLKGTIDEVVEAAKARARPMAARRSRSRSSPPRARSSTTRSRWSRRARRVGLDRHPGQPRAAAGDARPDRAAALQVASPTSCASRRARATCRCPATARWCSSRRRTAVDSSTRPTCRRSCAPPRTPTQSRGRLGGAAPRRARQTPLRGVPARSPARR